MERMIDTEEEEGGVLNQGDSTALLASDEGLQKPLEDSADPVYTPSFCLKPCIKQLVLTFFRSSGDGLPKLRAAQWRSLLAVCLISLFSGFDWELLPLALKEIQTSLDIQENQLGLINSVIKLGSIPSFAIALYADIFGRRKALIGVATVFSFATFSTGFSPNLKVFVTFQFLARFMIEAKSSISTSLLLEQMDEHNRGWGLGMIQSMSALGGGISFIVFGIVGDLQEGWRVMYWLAVLQIPFLVFLVNKLPESDKFLDLNSLESAEGNGDTSQQVGGVEANEVLQGAKKRMKRRKETASHHFGVAGERIKLVFKAYPKRMAAAVTIAFLNGFAFAPGDLLKVKFMQEQKNLAPSGVAVLVIFSGAAAFLAFTLAGRLSDLYGRKAFLIVFSVVSTLGVIGFYRAPGHLWVAFFFLQLLSGFVLSVVSITYFGECFPTSVRSTAQSFLKGIGFSAGILSIALESVLYEKTQSHWDLVAWFALIALPSPIILHRYLPETAGRGLEEISPDGAIDSAVMIELAQLDDDDVNESMNE